MVKNTGKDAKTNGVSSVYVRRIQAVKFMQTITVYKFTDLLLELARRAIFHKISVPK